MQDVGNGYLLEDGTGRYLLEDGTGVYLLESAPAPISMNNYLFVNAGGSGSEKIR